MPRSRSRTPLVKLPFDGNPRVELYVDQTSAVAVCLLCKEVIATNSTRFSLKVKLGRKDKFLWQTYSIHTGCLATSLNNEVPRTEAECWDCKEELERTTPYLRCFISQEVPAGRICYDCAGNARWANCAGCLTVVPSWMAHAATLKDDKRFFCDYCVEYYNVCTDSQREEQRKDFERLRQEIKEKGIYGDP